MALLSEPMRANYPQPEMQAEYADGPWGAAVQYWLDKLRWRQADLSRATGIEPKTISSIVRGFDTTTRVLRKIALALDREAARRSFPNQITFEDVLVSPDRKSAIEIRKQMIHEITERVTRELEARITPKRLPPAVHHTMSEMIADVEALAEEVDDADEAPPAREPSQRRVVPTSIRSRRSKRLKANRPAKK